MYVITTFPHLELFLFTFVFMVLLVPNGILKALYREGKAVSCDGEVQRYRDCLAVMFSVVDRQVQTKT